MKNFNDWIKNLGENIAKIRRENGLNQEKFAYLMSVSQSVIARIEKGQNMRCSTLWKISKILNINFSIEEKEEKYVEIKPFFAITSNLHEVKFKIYSTNR